MNDNGGAIVNRGTLSVIDCTLSDSHAINGGAIYNDSGAELTVSQSIFNGNSTTPGFGKGGALYNAGTFNIENSTFGGNTAYFAASIYNAPNAGPLVSLDATTIAFNQALIVKASSTTRLILWR